MYPKFCPIFSGSDLAGGGSVLSLEVCVVSVVVVMGGVVGVIGDPGVTEGSPAEGESTKLKTYLYTTWLHNEYVIGRGVAGK